MVDTRRLHCQYISDDNESEYLFNTISHNGIQSSSSRHRTDMMTLPRAVAEQTRRVVQWRHLQ